MLVVPGVGDEEPGATAGLLARGLAAYDDCSRIPSEEVLWLQEGERRRRVTDFPCHVERLCQGGTETVLAEVYWADLSRVGHGLLATVGSLILVIFGLSDVARKAADNAIPGRSRRNPAAAALRGLSTWISLLIRGPIAVFAALLLAAGGTSMAVAGLLPEDSVFQAFWTVTSYLVVGLVALAVGAWAPAAWRDSRGGAFRPMFVCLPVGGLIYIGVLLFASSAKGRTLLSELAAARHFPHAEGQLDVASAAVIFNLPTIGFLTLVMALLLAGTLTWAVARWHAESCRRPGLDLAAFSIAFAVGALLLVGHTISVAAYWQLRNPQSDDFQHLMERAVPLLSLQWIGVTTLAVCLLAVWRSRRRWAQTESVRSNDARQLAPRLIVSRWILFPLVAFTALTAAVEFALVLENRFSCYLPEFFNAGSLQMRELLTRGNEYAIPATALITTLAIYLVGKLRQGIDFALDATTYLTGSAVLRSRIQNRFRHVMRQLIGLEAPDQVLVVAHSQGTILAIDVLRNSDVKGLLQPLERCDLVTMGSPFDHLYQHYFRNDYPPLSSDSPRSPDRWQFLREVVPHGRWRNIFRIDDYIGTEIEPKGEWPENCEVGPGGHTGYWVDRQVLDILRKIWAENEDG